MLQPARVLPFIASLSLACSGAPMANPVDMEDSGPDTERPQDGGVVGDSTVASDGSIPEYTGELAGPHRITEADKAAARAALEAHDGADFAIAFDPARIYADFRDFALTHYGAVEHPLVYAHMGDVLALQAEADWIHASNQSAALGFATTLPARSFVEYGETPDLGQRTAESDRYYYAHLHHLTGLTPERTYHYRLAGYDERGRVVRSEIRQLTTSAVASGVPVPGTLAGPPYILDQRGATYVLTEDISADGTALVISADGLTLDLGGHTVTYSNAARSNISNGSADTAQTGVYVRSRSGVRIVNGRLKEGHVGNAAGVASRGLHSLFLADSTDQEVAGVIFEYHGAQVYAVHAPGARGVVDVHHNQWLDGGWEILDRHGSGGSRCLYLPNTTGPNAFEIGWNLVKRARHTCFHNADLVHDNEIYGDSWATNAFLLGGHSAPGVDGGRQLRNKVFLTGYHGIGFGWAHQGYVVKDNLVHMENIRTERRRWYESYGDWDSLNAFRITNYSDGGQVRDGLRYENNTVIGRARGGGMIRGTEFFTDRSITDVVISGGVIQIVADDAETLDVTPVVAQGVTSHRREAQPLYYRDMRLVSNVANVRFGDSYGKGDNHRLEGCVFERVGSHPDYHTVVFDGTYDSQQHVLLDPVFVGGARYDDVWWRATSVQSAYAIAYTLNIEGPPSGPVSVEDASGSRVFAGILGSDGTLKVPLTMATIHPSEYASTTSGGVRAPTDHMEDRQTPHSVTVGGNRQGVTMDQPRTLVFP